MSIHQSEFDKKYISSSEIRSRLNIGRSFVNWAKTHGKLPEPIRISPQAPDLWLRSEIEPIIKSWGDDLRRSRGV